jgi:hypothetical protein
MMATQFGLICGDGKGLGDIPASVILRHGRLADVRHLGYLAAAVPHGDIGTGEDIP